MTRTPWITLALAGLFLAPFSLSVQAQQVGRDIEEEQEDPEGRASLRVSVNQINVDVTVQDRDGNLIGGLSKHHFKIYENKVEQEVTYFSPVEAPMTAILVTEYSSVIPWEWLYEAWNASYLFADQMRPEDWVAAVAYDIRPEILVDFTQNKAQVFNALRKLNTPAFRESNFYDAIWDVMDRIEEVENKVAIILISSGLDTFSKKNLDDTLEKARKTNAVIYAISLGGNNRARYDQNYSTSTRMDLYQADAVLKALAKYTGGVAFFPRFAQAHKGIFQTISLLLRNQYSLGYVSTNTKKDGKLRKIKVEVMADVDGDGKPDKKLKVKHREGYVVEKIG
ncbi:MAG: VWA domain-containing protein [Acidobacteriota bacterium]